MSFLGLNGWEPIILILVFLVFIGPQRLPEYTQKAMGWIRDVRKWTDESRASLENEMGIAVEDLKKYDPRQYDPRRIIREAWDSTGLEQDFADFNESAKNAMSLSGSGAAAAGTAAASTTGSSTGSSAAAAEIEGTPFDPEAT